MRWPRYVSTIKYLLNSTTVKIYIRTFLPLQIMIESARHFNLLLSYFRNVIDVCVLLFVCLFACMRGLGKIVDAMHVVTLASEHISKSFPY